MVNIQRMLCLQNIVDVFFYPAKVATSMLENKIFIHFYVDVILRRKGNNDVPSFKQIVNVGLNLFFDLIYGET